MKIIILLFFVSISLPVFRVNAQQQVVVMPVHKQSLSTVLEEIETQTDYLFFYNVEDINKNDSILLCEKKYDVHKILTSISETLKFNYKIIGRHIILTRLTSQVPGKNQSMQIKEYKGIVMNLQEQPLAGAHVMIKGSTLGTLTDKNGYFSLLATNDTIPVFCFSFIGYQAREIKGETGVVCLQEETQVLDEVQVIAYGVQKKPTVTGAISSIDTKGLLKSPNGSVANTLSGALSGISSVQVSGQPGAEDPEVFVRGTGSLSVENSRPLILVDGIERSFFQMDPNEIENINVLKDAASTAVFGVRGANGVILVTTRRGTKGKPSVSISSSAGLTQPLRNMHMVDSYTHAMLYTEAQLNDNPSLPPSRQIFSPSVIQKFKDKSDPFLFPSIDWNAYMFRKASWQTHHNLTISGGGERFRYFISIGYLYQDGILKRFTEPYDPNYMYNRYNYRANIDMDISPTTLMKCNISGRISSLNVPNGQDLWRTVMWAVPYSSPGIINGKYIRNTERYIPIAMTTGLDAYYNQGYNTNTSNVFDVDWLLEQKLDFITPGLKAEAKVAYNSAYTISRSRSFSGVIYSPVYKSTLVEPGLSMDDPGFDNTVVFQKQGEENEVLGYSYSTNRSRDWYGELSLRYEQSFNNHTVTALLLYNQSKNYYPLQFTEIPAAYVGLVGRITYNYRMRYLFDLNAGYNGSENFASGKRFGFFPSASAGWIISSEPFMRNQAIVDFMKLRLSYGLVGNDKYSGARFLYLMGAWDASNMVTHGLGSYNFGQYSGTMLPDAKELAMGNSSVTWETVSKQNYGIDFKMLASRLSITADVFFEKRRNILSRRKTLPSITAVELPLVNLGKVNNQGYELSIGWNHLIQHTRYWLTATISYAKNKIIYMDEVPPNEPYMIQTGRSIGLNYGYIFDRFFKASDFDEKGNLSNPDIPKLSVIPRPGDVIYKDLNHDGKVDSNDKTYFGYSDRPEYVMGLLGGFEWNDFELSMQWTGAMHASRMLQYEYRNAFGTSNNRGLLEYLANGRWTPEAGSGARFPRLTFMNKEYNQQTSNLWLMDAAYLRLKVLELSYNLKCPELKKLGIESVRFYCNGYNLLTLFSDLNNIDIDPEGRTGLKTENTDMYPNIRIYNFGVNLKF